MSSVDVYEGISSERTLQILWARDVIAVIHLNQGTPYNPLRIISRNFTYDRLMGVSSGLLVVDMLRHLLIAKVDGLDKSKSRIETEILITRDFLKSL